jgi:hypothetical protein
LDLNEDAAQAMASPLRDGLVANIPAVILACEVEADTVYVVAGKGKAADPGRGWPKVPPSAAWWACRHLSKHQMRL